MRKIDKLDVMLGGGGGGDQEKIRDMTHRKNAKVGQADRYKCSIFDGDKKKTRQ
jgi:hypothetical protein